MRSSIKRAHKVAILSECGCANWGFTPHIAHLYAYYNEITACKSGSYELKLQLQKNVTFRLLLSFTLIPLHRNKEANNTLYLHNALIIK